MRVLVFGDSITQGFFDRNGGWVSRIRKAYDKKYIDDKVESIPTIFNLGVSGDMTSSLLNRIDLETKSRQNGEEIAMIIAIGTNDTIYHGEEYESTPERYQEQLIQLTAKVRQFSDKILFVGLFPVIDELLQPFPWSSTGKCYSTERIVLFDKTLKNFCKINKLPVVDLFTPFSKHNDLKSMFFDGIHPNDDGHKLIAELVRPHLERLLV